MKRDKAPAHRSLVAVLERPGAPLPGLGDGDRVFALVVKSRSFPQGPALTGSATVVRGTPAQRLRRGVSLDAAEAIALRSFSPPLHCAVGWTDARLEAMVKTCAEIDAQDARRIEEALLDKARRVGPPAKRPAHSRPRTPGRRALGEGRAAVSGSRRGIGGR